VTSAPDAPTVIEPSRVLVLTEDEQNAIIDAYYEREGNDSAARLAERIAHGDEYYDATDELVRKTLIKRRLEAEIRRLNTAIARCEEQVIEDWMARGNTKGGHEATGATLGLTRRVYAKLDVDVDGLDKEHAEQVRAAAKARLCEAMTMVDDLAPMVVLNANLQTVSAYFSAQIKEYDAEQRDLPEHERVPRDPDSFVPEPLRGLLKLDASPRITVRG